MDRLFDFDGSIAEYVKCLESELLKFRPLATETLSPNSPPPSPGPANDTASSVPPLHHCLEPMRDTGLQFVYYNLITRPAAPRPQPQWKTDLRKFLQSIPELEQWKEKRRQVGTATVEKNRLAIQAMLGWPSEVTPALRVDVPPEIPELKPEDNISMIAGACKYGSQTWNSKLNMELSVLLAKYQQLIFVSYCVVLLEIGNSTQTINRMLRHYVSDSGPKNLMQYRYGCLWVNRCVASLLTQGWNYKSWEVFLLCAQPLHQYRKLANFSNKSHEMFTCTLERAQVPISEREWIPYCIPSIIKVLAGDDLELPQICLSLGYNVDLVSQIHHTFFMPFNPFHHLTHFNPFHYIT